MTPLSDSKPDQWPAFRRALWFCFALFAAYPAFLILALGKSWTSLSLPMLVLLSWGLLRWAARRGPVKFGWIFLFLSVPVIAPLAADFVFRVDWGNSPVGFGFLQFWTVMTASQDGRLKVRESRLFEILGKPIFKK